VKAKSASKFEVRTLDGEKLDVENITVDALFKALGLITPGQGVVLDPPL
jgi:hypothetical protein